jgi:hypothetical protein
VARGREKRTFRLAARSLVQYSTVHSVVNCTDVKIYIEYIGLMFGHFESESGIQQNAGIKGIDAVARRDSRSNIYNNIYAS